MEYTDIAFNDIQEFPYMGKFLRSNRDVDAEENPIEEMIEILRVKCDIEVSTPDIQNTGQQANYNVWIPLLKKDDKMFYPITYDDVFYGIRFGQKIKGIVINVEPSQMGTRVWLKVEDWGQDDTQFDDLM